MEGLLENERGIKDVRPLSRSFEESIKKIAKHNFKKSNNCLILVLFINLESALL